MAEQVQLDTFNLLHHKRRPSIESKLDALLKEYASQFAKDETSIGTTPLMEMTINMGTFWSCIPETIPDCYEELPMGERWNWETP